MCTNWKSCKKNERNHWYGSQTIHRLLEIGKFEEDKLGSIDTEVTPIDTDVLVIDEMSMVDVFIMNYISRAVYLGTKVILLEM